MKLIFFGSGGGRMQVYKQIRKTAGFYLELDKKILIDPGLGSYLWFAMKFDNIIDIEKLDYILVSHAHIDHCHDIVPYIDRVTWGGTKKRPLKLLASPSVIEGREFGPCIDKRYLSYLESYEIFEENKKYDLSEKTKLEVLKNNHTDPWTFSMKIKHDKLTIGYISDTSYFDELIDFFKGSDILIINTLRPLNDKHPYHLTANQAFKIARAVKPKLTILHHQGFKMLGREIEHLQFFNKRNVFTLLSYEGLEIDLRTLNFRYLLNKPSYYPYLKELLEKEKLKKFRNSNLNKYLKNKSDFKNKFLEELKKQFEPEDMNLNETWVDKKRLF
ncbi:MAG: MBL fold metallo-hydrolase [Nanoarchaeota archaeon]